MSYMLIRDLEPLLWLQVANRARKNKRSFSEEALILIQLGLVEKRKARPSKRAALLNRRQTSKRRS